VLFCERSEAEVSTPKAGIDDSADQLNSFRSKGLSMRSLIKLSKSLFRAIRHWQWETFSVPKISSATADGIKLDLGNISLEIKKAILGGYYEHTEISMCKELIDKDDLILELGSAVGFVSLFCLKYRSAKAVYCVEANPETLKILERNYRANGYEPNFLHGALASSNGDVHLQIGIDFLGHSIFQPLQPTQSQDPKHEIIVPGFTFQSIWSKVPFRPNALIADVEGAELFIPWKELPSGIAKVIIELHPQLIGAKASGEIVTSLSQQGFEMFWESGAVFGFQRVSDPN
jgi:FkbM family methyltransferase